MPEASPAASPVPVSTDLGAVAKRCDQSRCERRGLPLSAAGDLALRRIAPRVPTGQSVEAYCTYRDFFAEELPGIDVGSITGDLSPAWLPLPLDAIAVLCAGTAAGTLLFDSLVTRSPGLRGWLGWPHWELAYVTDHPGESDW